MALEHLFQPRADGAVVTRPMRPCPDNCPEGPCDTCGGSGYVPQERREDHSFRALLAALESAAREPILRELHKADELCALRTEQVNERDDQIARLLEENRRLREAITKAARTIERIVAPRLAAAETERVQ